MPFKKICIENDLLIFHCNNENCSDVQIWENKKSKKLFSYVNFLFSKTAWEILHIFSQKSFCHIIDHLEFTLSRAVIVLFLKNHKRYLNSVVTKTFLGFYPKR